MSKASSKSDLGQDDVQSRMHYLYLLLEVTAVILLVGGVLWLLFPMQSRGPVARLLLNAKLWILILVISALGTAGNLVPYYIGQQGTKVIFERYPRLEGRPWQQLDTIFKSWGAVALVLSGIPMVGAAFRVAAGAFGIRRWPFLWWCFVGKVLRNWVLAFIVLFSLDYLG